MENLTKREKEVLMLIVYGKTNKEIANCLNISLNTAKYYVKRIFGKLKVKTRIEAAIYGVKHGGECSGMAFLSVC